MDPDDNLNDDEFDINNQNELSLSLTPLDIDPNTGIININPSLSQDDNVTDPKTEIININPSLPLDKNVTETIEGNTTEFYEIRETDEEENLKIHSFIENSCGCKIKPGKLPCSSYFNYDQIGKYRNQCFELTRGELDLTILGQIAALGRSKHFADAYNILRPQSKGSYYLVLN